MRSSQERYIAVVLPFALAVAALTLVAVLSVSIMSMLRAYVAGESHWSKGQKAAIATLQRYLVTADEQDFQQFRNELAVPLSDLSARREMDKDQPDWELVRTGFLGGRNAEEDIGGMVWLYRNFKQVPLMARAIAYWKHSDEHLLRLRDLGERLHATPHAARPAQDVFLLELQEIDRRLSPLALGFASAINEAARQVTHALLGVLVLSAALLAWSCHSYLRRAFLRRERLLLQLQQSQAEAFAEKELVQVTLGSIADAVITTDQEQRVSYCNRNAEQMLGLPSDMLVGRPLDEVCRLQGAEGSVHLHLQSADGRQLPVDRSLAPIHAPDGQAIGQVIVLHDASEARRHAAQLSYQATHDELTDILNRREFERRLCELLAGLQEGRQGEHAVLYLDLDRFKVINDTSGHAAGDELIRQVSQLLQATLRERDIVGRLGGDEFGIVLTQCSHSDALHVAEKVRQAVVDLRFLWGVRSYRIGVSIGVVLLAGRQGNLKEVMKSADAACYMAKEKGRNRIHLYSDDDAELSVRQTEMEAVSRIRAALEHDRFCLYLQTIAPLKPGGQAHAEVLVRMLDEQGGLIPPMAFIPAAERYDLMPLLDRWVIRHAFAALAQQPPGTSWAINLSGASVCDEGLLEYVLAQQRACGVALENVCFEITETAAVGNLAQAAALIQNLQTLGCRFALDDFGAGMSSFAYLKHLPVDYVKIDGSFIRGILHSPTERAMVESINQIAHVMGKQTIAEFVEAEAELACLRAMGVDYAQGYGVGRPQPLSEWQAANKAAKTTQIDALS
ncbi:EAL domain-containing protein [Pseudoduganella sp. DS3]|uniref:EAL domain-containing protein n=1 Tax=Pseudoduganella guangdongensis TaxID=2692179 RepID=A0A6N9HE72_9BURK|nr:EAL domain-containing protein [Pseudoduganella guangdongensis]MYN01861.1 EAL domain-containing protein [Pseudoduganella guangdongensis]